jgi:hypothetical protein
LLWLVKPLHLVEQGLLRPMSARLSSNRGGLRAECVVTIILLWGSWIDDLSGPSGAQNAAFPAFGLS